MNIAYLLLALAVFCLALSVRGMSMKVPSALFGNLALAIALSVVAVVAYPHHEAYLHGKAIERLRLAHQAELDRIRALNSAFLSPQIGRAHV